MVNESVATVRDEATDNVVSSTYAVAESESAVNNPLHQTQHPSIFTTMSMLDKFRKGAQKAGLQATAFVQASSTKVASGSRDFVQGFSLPSEAEKAANILDSFLGVSLCFVYKPMLNPFNSLLSRPRSPRISSQFHSEGCAATCSRSVVHRLFAYA
jgi:hypothetical protein